MGIALLVIGLLIGLGGFGFLMYKLIKFVKSSPLGGLTPKIEGNDKIIFIALVAGIGVGTVLSNFGLVKLGNMPITLGEHFLMLFGSYFFGSGVSLLVSSFTLYYYRPDMDEKQRKVARILMFSAIPFVVVGLWMFTDAFAPYLYYPLVNCISFTKGIVNDTEVDAGFAIKFYGIVIVAGAAICYFISDHYFYKKFEKHGILDTCLVVAFPMGIIGARLWYCLVLEPGTNIFAIRQGGLAVQGGALLGIAAGVAFMLIFRRYVNIRWAMDIIIPTILIAQTLGRWGNFFNQEVYGAVADPSTYWWLPKAVQLNMFIDGEFRVPLFFIEGCMNLCGYFLIRFAVGKGLRKWLALGDISMCYLIWYGIVRIILEPLRDNEFGYTKSRITAIVFVAIGVLGIIGFHIYDLIRKKKGLPPKNLETI